MSIFRPTGQVYTAVFTGVAVTAAQDLFEITTPATTCVRIREIRLGQYSDFGDAQAEILSVQMITGYTVTGSGGSTITPAIVNRPSTAVAASTVKANNTTVANTGTAVTLYSDAWNVQGGWWYCPNEQEMLIIGLSTRFVIRSTAPADSLTMNGTLVFEEIGHMVL